MIRPKISVIIPVHNTARYLNQCLDSVVNQSLTDIEIICIDDASEDDSLSILNSMALKDSRVKVLHNDVSQSALGARKKGIEEANGEYIMFLDSDDYLSLDGCENAYNKIVSENVDILQFETKVINCADIPKTKIDAVQNYLKPYAVRIDGNALLNDCFLNSLYSHNLSSKIIKASICKSAVKDIENEYMPFAEDLYMYFIIADKAESYIGYAGDTVYHYCLGRGISGNQKYSLDRFKKLCMHAKTLQCLNSYCQKQPSKDELQPILDKLYSEWINDCVGVWYADVDSADKPQALKYMFEYWGAAEITALLAKRFWNKRTEIADKIGTFKITPLEKREIKTVAFYYYCYSIGGVERVLSLIMPVFVKMGYRVILLTDKPQSENDFPLSQGVERYVLFDKDAVTPDNYMQRALSLQKVIKEQKVDVVLYNFWRSHLFLWDNLYIKGMDVPVVLVAHGVFSLALAEFHKNFSEHTKTFALADAMTVLSNVDKIFWETYVDRVYYMPNPIDKKLSNLPPVKWENKSVIWLGRATPEKNPEAPLKIMKKVVNKVPDAKLYLVGDFDTPEWEEKVKEYGLKNNIVITGFVSDVAQYLEKSSVHLMTSNFEGFPMALVEAKAYGIPTVMFGMPHIVIGKKDCGTIGVDMLDYDNAASEIVKLLQNQEYWQTNSELSTASVNQLINFDFEKSWNDIFSGKTQDKLSNSLTDNFVKTVVNHYDLGAKELAAKQAYLRQRKSLSGKIKGGLSCVKEKGFTYTLRLLLKK